MSGASFRGIENIKHIMQISRLLHCIPKLPYRDMSFFCGGEEYLHHFLERQTFAAQHDAPTKDILIFVERVRTQTDEYGNVYDDEDEITDAT